MYNLRGLLPLLIGEVLSRDKMRKRVSLETSERPSTMFQWRLEQEENPVKAPGRIDN